MTVRGHILSTLFSVVKHVLFFAVVTVLTSVILFWISEEIITWFTK